MKYIKNNIWLFIFCCCIAGVVILTIDLFQTNETVLAIISAVISVFMTMTATFFLLKGQTKAEQEKDNLTEIFKERLKSYNEFLSTLGDYVENPKDKNLETRLKFRTSALGMHTDSNNMIIINKNVKKVIDMAQQDNEGDLLKTLFEISNVFNSILYKDNSSKESINNSEYDKSIASISHSLDSITEEVSDTEIQKEDLKEQEELEKQKSPIENWEQFKAILQKENWQIQEKNDTIEVVHPGVSSFIRIRKPSKNQFYIIEMIDEKDDNELARKIKNRHKGNVRGGRWYRDLTSLPNYGIKNGNLINSLANNDKVRAVVIKWIDKLIKEIS